MIVFPVADTNSDVRRKLTAFRPPPDFPRVVEAKVLRAKKEGIVLGNHSHPHVEGFFLVQGHSTIRTWTLYDGVQEQQLAAPVMFMFEPDEEHILVCSRGMILVGYSPVTYADENNTTATHL